MLANVKVKHLNSLVVKFECLHWSIVLWVWVQISTVSHMIWIARWKKGTKHSLTSHSYQRHFQFSVCLFWFDFSLIVRLVHDINVWSWVHVTESQWRKYQTPKKISLGLPIGSTGLRELPSGSLLDLWYSWDG